MVGLSPSASANTQILETVIARLRSPDPVSDDLELLEELHDALERLAVVLDLLAGLALGRGADRHDLLAGAGPADLVGARGRGRPTVTWSTGLFFAAMIPLNDG